MNIQREKLRCLPMAGLAYLGDGGDSTQQSSTNTTNTTNVADNRAVADAGATIATGGSVVTNNTSDLGSIQAAKEVSEQAIVGATKLATEANAKAGALAVASIDFAKGITEELKGAYESGGKVLAIGALIVGGYLLLSAQGKK